MIIKKENIKIIYDVLDSQMVCKLQSANIRNIKIVY